MIFEQALAKLRAGQCVCRMGWQRERVFLYLVPGSRFRADRPPLLGIYPEGAEINYAAHIDQRTASGLHAPWSPRTEDLLADDWITTAG